MPKPTEGPFARHAPSFAASIMPGPPPVPTVYAGRPLAARSRAQLVTMPARSRVTSNIGTRNSCLRRRERANCAMGSSGLPAAFASASRTATSNCALGLARAEPKNMMMLSTPAASNRRLGSCSSHMMRMSRAGEEFRKSSFLYAFSGLGPRGIESALLHSASLPALVETCSSECLRFRPLVFLSREAVMSDILLALVALQGCRQVRDRWT
mmetsp:Transcript_33331/g.85159  ORF Transcript_33331/g.85159 Transcript_33331/m.85159 type:complete len:211 (-) Transcript_33331:21-653(-)